MGGVCVCVVCRSPLVFSRLVSLSVSHALILSSETMSAPAPTPSTTADASEPLQPPTLQPSNLAATGATAAIPLPQAALQPIPESRYHCSQPNCTERSVRKSAIAEDGFLLSARRSLRCFPLLLRSLRTRLPLEVAICFGRSLLAFKFLAHGVLARLRITGVVDTTLTRSALSSVTCAWTTESWASHTSTGAIQPSARRLLTPNVTGNWIRRPLSVVPRSLFNENGLRCFNRC